ncbi:MAG: nucleoside hydrolase [Bryobacteraceae bacterium]
MQFPPQGKPPVGVIFDSDLGNRIDDILALALLYGLDGKNEARMVSVSVTKSTLRSAALAEVIGRFYAGAVSGAFAAAGRTLPVGMAEDGRMKDDTPLMKGVLDRKTPEGKPTYDHGIHRLNDTAEPTAVIRNAFTGQHDQNCLVLLAGPATNLVKVLDLPGVPELIARKVRYLVVAGGDFASSAPEPNFAADLPAIRKLLAEWPTSIVFAGQELGAALRYPAASIEADFTWSQAQPVVDAYRAAQTMPYDAPARTMAAALYAIRPEAGLFKLSTSGRIEILDSGAAEFAPSEGGKHRYLTLDPAKQDQIVKTFTEIASAKPVPRVRRFRPPDQQQKAAPPKPAAPKPDAAKPQQ